MARELSMDSMRSLHSWLVVLSYLYLVESSSFSWIWSRRLSNLEQGLSGSCQNHTQSPPIGGASAGKRRAADVPAADQSGHGPEQGVRAKALIHLRRQSKLRLTRLTLTTPSPSSLLLFAINLCCAWASLNSADTSSKASLRSLMEERFKIFYLAIEEMIEEKT